MYIRKHSQHAVPGRSLVFSWCKTLTMMWILFDHSLNYDTDDPDISKSDTLIIPDTSFNRSYYILLVQYLNIFFFLVDTIL